GKHDSGNHPVERISVLAEFSCQHLVKALQAAAAVRNIQLDIWEADYDSVDTYVLNSDSDLYRKSFDYIVIYWSVLKWYKKFGYSDKARFGQEFADYAGDIIRQLTSQTRSRVLLCNFPEWDDSVFGNY